MDQTNAPSDMQAAGEEADGQATVYFMNLRAAPLLRDQPQVRITHWRLAQLPDDTVVLVGVVPGGPDALTVRITSPIRCVDVAARLLQTWSGRVYVLVGDPATAPFMRTVLAERLARSGLEDAVDVTDALFVPAHGAGLHS